MRWIFPIFLVSMILLSGCLDQAPTPQATETPAPTTITPAPTMTTPPMTSFPPKTTAPLKTTPPTTAPPAPPKDYNSIMRDLEKNFPKLASELKELPELKGNSSESDLEALNDIYYLWKNATNSEVKEAFDLMIKGGTPSQKDFSYQVPTYNTELEVLFWLAEQNEFHFNDTLAQSLAMVNGLWVTMGDDEVRKAVKKDTNDLLDYFRETNEWQRERGFYLLEDYPLEAKICLAWTGDDVLRSGYGPHNQKGSEAPHNIFEYLSQKMDIKAYNWNTISISGLRKARNHVIRKNWINKDADKICNSIEEYLYTGINRKWESGLDKGLISVDGEMVVLTVLHNGDYLLDYFIRNDKGIGVCDDEATLVSILLKSVGISTNFVYKIWKGLPFTGNQGHTFNIYYNPEKQIWTGNEWQLSTHGIDKSMQDPIDFYVFRLPIKQDGYVKVKPERLNGILLGLSYYRMLGLPNQDIYDLFKKGIPASQMKQWLLYT